MPLNDMATSAPGIFSENGTAKHAKQSLAKPEISATSNSNMGSGSGAGAGAGVSLYSLQGQKWQQVFDLDKVIKQLRTAEKTYLRGGKNGSSGGSGDQQHQSQQQQLQQAKVQVQRLQSADMAYYDLVPKLATRDIVLCGSCSGSYTKAGFQHHIALQHPSVWDATSNKLNPNASGNLLSSESRLTATENSQEPGGGVGGSGGIVPSSPTDTLSASTLSSCSNGSSSSVSLQNQSVGTSSSTTSSSSSSSRHKSSSSKSSSSKGSSSTSGGSRARSKSSKNRHHSSPAPAPALESNHKDSNGKGSKRGSGSAIAAPPLAAIKEEPLNAAANSAAAITVFSSSSNSSCSLPPTPTIAASSDMTLGVNYSPAQLQTETEKLPELQPKKKLKGSSDHRTKAEKEKNKSKNLGISYGQQQHVLSELDQAVSSITGAEAEQATPDEEELPLPNTSDENSISQTLDEMLDSKLINEILNNFDESELDTAQQQQQQQQPQQQSQNGSLPHPAQATKRLRFADGTICAETGEDYTIYQSQVQQEGQQVYTGEGDPQQGLTTIDAMQLQQLIYQQQQMLEQQQQQEQHHGQQQQDQKLQDPDQQRQFSVYNVQSIGDGSQQPQQQQLEEHMILPSIIYEIADGNSVSMLEQQKVLAEFLTQAGYENVDVNVLQSNMNSGVPAEVNHLAEELNDFEFHKLETVSDNVKTVKLEATSQPLATAPNHHPSLANAKYHEDGFFNVMMYSGPPRPLALNTFGMVKLPQGLGVTFRKNLLTTRKANNNLLSLTGGSHQGVVGQLARPPPPPPSPALSNGLPGKNPAVGRTIYAQRSSVIAQDRLRCNKRALVGNKSGSGGSGAMTAKRLNELLMGKVKKEEKPSLESDEMEQQKDKEREKTEDQKQQLTYSFYEKRRRLLAGRQEKLQPLSPKFNLPLLTSNNNNNASLSQSHSPQHLLKKQLLRTLSEINSNINLSSSMNSSNSSNNSSGNITNSNNTHTPNANSNPPWKGSSNSNLGGNSTPTSGDLMRVFD